MLRLTIPAALILGCALACPAVEKLTDRSGASHEYDTIEIDPATPKTAVMLRRKGELTALRLSQVDPAVLTEEQRTRIAEFTAAKKADGFVLHQDEWVDRDGMLLKTDTRFAYPRVLTAAGENFLEVINKSEGRLTVGVRIGEREALRGRECSVAPFKSAKIRLSPGTYYLLLVERLPGGEELAVTRRANIALTNHHYTLTYGVKDGTRGEDMGRIAIPAEMR